MYVTISDLAAVDESLSGVTYDQLKSLASQVLQMAQGAPPWAQSQVQSIMNRNTPFPPPFNTVGGLAQKLQSYNPPPNFYDQDFQVLNQALTDLNAVASGGTPATMQYERPVNAPGAPSTSVGIPVAAWSPGPPTPGGSGLPPPLPSMAQRIAERSASPSVDASGSGQAAPAGDTIMGFPKTYVLVGVGGVALIGLALVLKKKKAPEGQQFPGYPPMMGYQQPPAWGYQQPYAAPQPPRQAAPAQPAAPVPPVKANRRRSR